MRYSRCPQCSAQGRDTTGDNLAHYSDGVYCHACGYSTGNGANRGKKQRKAGEVYYPEQVCFTEYLKPKGIKPETAAAFEVAEVGELDSDTGEIVGDGVIVFPFYNADNKLVGLKYRDYYGEQVEGRSRKECIRYKGVSELFGLHMLQGRDELVITEGETDMLRLWQADNGGATKDFLAVPGARQAALLKPHSVLVRKYRKVFICTDADAAGRALAEALAEYVPNYLLHTCDYGRFSVKDACEMKDADIPLLYAKAYRPNNTATITEDNLQEGYLAYQKATKNYKFVSTGFYVLDDMLAGGLMRSDVVMLIAHTGAGKSTFAVDIAYNVMTEGHKVLFVPTEMSGYQTITKFIERDLGISTLSRSCTQEMTNKSLQDLSKFLQVYTSDDFGWQSIEDAICSAIYQHDIELVVIDVLNNLDEFIDWQKAAQLMTKINKLAAGNIDEKRPPVCIFLVAHTKFTEGRFAKRLTRSSIAGGKAIIQQVTSCIGLELGDETGEPTEERTLRLIKPNRFRDTTVYQGAVSYDSTEKRYYELQMDDV